MTQEEIVDYLKDNLVIEVSVMSNVMNRPIEETNQIMDAYNSLVKDMKNTLSKHCSSVIDKGFMG